MKIIIEICLLSEIGFTDDEIKMIFDRNKKYQHEKIKNVTAKHTTTFTTETGVDKKKGETSILSLVNVFNKIKRCVVRSLGLLRRRQ